MINSFDKITEFYSEKLPFVVYRKPQNKNVVGFFMKDDALVFTENFKEKGFIFAPFLSEDKVVLFPEDNAFCFSEELIVKDDFKDIAVVANNQQGKEKHLKIVKDAIAQIKSATFEKVVISREETVYLSHVDIVQIYKKLLFTYANAFVYVWYHPKIGLWFGATPETLLEIKGNFFKTMSLAGTQVHKGIENVVWKTKELEEQQLVTDFIESQLQNMSHSIQITKAETIKAGDLLHLRSKVIGNLNKDASLEKLIRALHPTPAVCGLPRYEARTFILNNENYNRSFYTGFLGEINSGIKGSEKSSHLFVNLRCMKIENNKAFIYVGGGITKDSDAVKEWEETVSKAKTMKRSL